jgi:hypothetical protein
MNQLLRNAQYFEVARQRASNALVEAELASQTSFIHEKQVSHSGVRNAT